MDCMVRIMDVSYWEGHSPRSVDRMGQRGPCGSTINNQSDSRSQGAFLPSRRRASAVLAVVLCPAVCESVSTSQVVETTAGGRGGFLADRKLQLLYHRPKLYLKEITV